jgi:LemA protein
VRRFPSNIFAGLFGFKKKDGFEAVAGSDKAVEIKF